MPTIPAIQETEEGDHKFKASTGKVSEALSQSQNANPKAGGMIQEVVQDWPTVLKDLG
jgi:hypothetical protein